MPSVPLEGEIWRRDLHQLPNDRSIITRELLVVPERQSYLTSITPATGAVRWSAKVENTWGWLAHGADHVFYLNQHARLQCFVAETGEERWVTDLQGINGWLVPAGPLVLVGGWRGYTPLAAVEAASGAVRWQREWAARQRVAEPLVGPWGVAVASLDEPLMRFLVPETGVAVTEVSMPAHGHAPDASPLMRRHGETLLLAARDGRVYRLRSPRHSWETLFEHPGGIITIAPRVLGDDLVFMDAAGDLNCYELSRGQSRWSTRWEHGRVDKLPAAISPAGMLAVGSANGRISVFDRSGTELWAKVVAKRVETDLAWLDDETLVAGITSGVVAFRPSKK